MRLLVAILLATLAGLIYGWLVWFGVVVVIYLLDRLSEGETV